MRIVYLRKIGRANYASFDALVVVGKGRGVVVVAFLIYSDRLSGNGYKLVECIAKG